MTRKSAVPSLLLLSALCAAPLAVATAATDRPLHSFPPAQLAEPAQTTGAPTGAPAGPADVLFVVGGDNRPAAKGAPLPRVLGTIFAELALIRPDLVIWTGDTVYGYCDSRQELEQEYQDFAAAARPVAGVVPLFNSPGNHEIHSQQTCKAPADQLCGAPCSEEAFRRHFGELYGSFDYAGVHFIALDTDVPGAADAITGEQLAWLKRDLEANKGARAIFVFSHTEFYSAPRIDPSAGTSHPAVANRWELQDLFRRYPVKAVFSGHEHIYWHEPPEQHDGIDYFVAGGAGAPLYATPDRGGFSHYLVVRVANEKSEKGSIDKVGYELIEPGHLYLEAVPGGPGEARLWIVDSNDLEDALPLRGVETEVPASLGGCADLVATAAFPKRDGPSPIAGVAIDACAATAGGRLRLHVKVPPLPQASVLLTIRRKAAG